MKKSAPRQSASVSDPSSRRPGGVGGGASVFMASARARATSDAGRSSGDGGDTSGVETADIGDSASAEEGLGVVAVAAAATSTGRAGDDGVEPGVVLLTGLGAPPVLGVLGGSAGAAAAALAALLGFWNIFLSVRVVDFCHVRLLSASGAGSAGVSSIATTTRPG